MADASDEQRWWSTQFADGVDPGLAIPDGMWESVASAVFDGDTGPPDENLLVDVPLDPSMDSLDEDVDFGRHLADQPVHGHDGGDPAAGQDYHDTAHHEFHGGSAGELEDDFEDAFGEDDTGYEME
jgi:hypothetical protein